MNEMTRVVDKLKKQETTEQPTQKPASYRRPQFYLLGNLETVQAYYTGRYRDGPRSSYWYDG